MPFADIFGHAPILGLLRQAVSRGRVPQSLLFAGPEGVGKRSVAIALAQAVNCPRRRAKGADDACGRCPTCTRIAAGTHSDVTLIEKGDEASIKIKTLRERLMDTVGYRPFEAERRVYIIDPADDITREAQDALLKTLEEPPAAAVIILITAYADTLLPTILSRCRRVRFGPLSEAEVVRVLVERLQVDRARAKTMAAASHGSVERALAEETGTLVDDRAAALAVLGAARGRSVVERLQAAAGMAQHKSKRRDREALGTRLDVLSSLLRDLGVIAAGAPDALANADLEDDLRTLSSGYALERVAGGFRALGEAQAALERNASPKIVADRLAMSL